MRYRKVDKFGDMLAYSEGGMLKDAEAVGACIRSRILSFEGEWWGDLDDGLPFLAMLGRMDEEREQIANALIRERILQTEGVLFIESFISKNEEKKREIHASVMTVFGATTVEVMA